MIDWTVTPWFEVWGAFSLIPIWIAWMTGLYFIGKNKKEVSDERKHSKVS